MLCGSLLIVFIFHLTTCEIHQYAEEGNGSYWFRQAQESLKANLKLKLNENIAKNIIFFLGDGMGLSTVTAARIFKGQQHDHPGEEGYLSFEKFPHVGLVKTYNVDKQVPDSAGTATAYLCGVKAKYETIGVDARVRLNDCNSSIGIEVSSILQWAQEAGKETGFVTTTRVTHASPAGLYAHSAHRDWEGDYEMPSNASRCKDIARQLIEDVPGININVVMGGGRRYFFPETFTDPKFNIQGKRKDGKNLVNDWKDEKLNTGKNAYVVYNKQQFDELDLKKSDFLLGLFDNGHMQYESDRDDGPRGQPSLTEMTKKAIQRLQKGPNGYFLFVEGGRIDHAHHDSLVRYSLEETSSFSDAIQTAIDMTSEDDTLIVVTADHSHVLTINGYPTRGNPILGQADVSDVDRMTYTTLMYTNGPGFPNNGHHRANLSGIHTDARNFTPQVAVRLTEETHGGEDVAVYAKGPMSHLFMSVHEQNYIPHAMAYAACIGVNQDHCTMPKEVVDHKSAIYKVEPTNGINGYPSKSRATKLKSVPWKLAIGMVIYFVGKHLHIS